MTKGDVQAFIRDMMLEIGSHEYTEVLRLDEVEMAGDAYEKELDGRIFPRREVDLPTPDFTDDATVSELKRFPGTDCQRYGLSNEWELARVKKVLFDKNKLSLVPVSVFSWFDNRNTDI